jgi:post-segregation antitoxin (ccd killing protein)
MPRMQVYLPDDLYKAVKEQQLPASELLQEAVRVELRRQELIRETDRYIEELANEVGQPSAESRRRADRLAVDIKGRGRSQKAV